MQIGVTWHSIYLSDAARSGKQIAGMLMASLMLLSFNENNLLFPL